MNDSRLLLQEFHTILTEYGEAIGSKVYRESLLRRIKAELMEAEDHPTPKVRCPRKGGIF